MDSVRQVEEVIRDFWATAPSNSLHLDTGEKAWAEPHVAVARGDDPLFLRFKELIGPFLWTPEEAYAIAFPEAPAPARELGPEAEAAKDNSASTQIETSADPIEVLRCAWKRLRAGFVHVESPGP